MFKRKIIYTKDVMIQDRDINPISDQEYEKRHKPYHNRSKNEKGNCMSCMLRYGIPGFYNYGSIQLEWENGNFEYKYYNNEWKYDSN